MSGRRSKQLREQARLLTKIQKPSNDPFKAALYYRDDLGWPIIPLCGPSEGPPAQRGKRPRFPGYRDWTCEKLTDELLNQHFGHGKSSNIGLVLRAPHVVVDLDSKHDAGVSAREWLDAQKHLANVPRERTGGGYHLHFHCPDLPIFRKPSGKPYQKALASTITPQVTAELFFDRLNVVLSPSVHVTGVTYEWEVTGDVPAVTWLQLQEWFGFKAPGYDKPCVHGDAAKEKWWPRYEGDLRTLNIVKLAKRTKTYGRLLSADERKHSLKCPWSDQHGDKGEHWTPADTSAVIYELRDGQFPSFHCLHQQHGPKNLEHFVDWAESQETGIVDGHCSRLRSHQNGHRAEDGRPRIALPKIGRPVGEFAAEAATAIRSLHKWFVTDGRVVEPRTITKEKLTYFGVPTLKPFEICAGIEQFIETGVIVNDRDSGEELFQPSTMSEGTARVVLGSPQFRNGLPPLVRVLEYRLPFSYKGKLTAQNIGYDARFATYTRPDAPKVFRIPFERAKALVSKALVGFPWKSSQDLTHAIARLLTPFCRGLMGWDARMPLWFFSANRSRAGKDYLNGVAQIVYNGYVSEDASLNRDPEEVRKRITTALMAGRRSMHFGNCRNKIDQTALEQAVTAKVWTDRVLGSNAEVQLANEMEFSLSANVGVSYTADFDARTRKIHLAYPDEDPNSRIFRQPDLHGWVLKHRGELLSAMGALVRNWYDKGQPEGSTPFTSFPEWGRVVGGIMEAAGFGDPCLPHEHDGSVGDDLTEAMRVLFTLCYNAHPENWIDKKEIYAVIDKNADEEALAEFGKLSVERSDQTRFGKNLQHFVGRLLNGILLERQASGRNGRSDRARFRFTKPPGPLRDSGMEIHQKFFGKLAESVDDTKSADLGNFGDQIQPVPQRKHTSTIDSSVAKGCQRRQPPSAAEADNASPLLLTDKARLPEIGAAIKAAGSAALDLETYGEALDPWRGNIRILSLALPHSSPVWLLDLSVIGYDLGPLGSALESVELIGHNVKFDSLWLRVKCGLKLAKLYCTCTASRLLTAGSLVENNLDACLSTHLGVNISKAEGQSDWGAMLLTSEQLAYCGNDVRYLPNLRNELEDKLREAGLQKVSKLEMALLPVVVDIEAQGFAVDRNRLEHLSDVARKEKAKATLELQAILGAKTNPASAGQLQSALNARGIAVGNTRDETLVECNDSTVVPIIRRYRVAAKREQDTEKLLAAIQSDGRIHGQFNPTGTDTGRFSSKEPNMQSIERGELRECFIADEGDVLIDADYSQIELRVAAAIAPEPLMLEAFQLGADLHVRTAAIVLNKPEDAVTVEERRMAKGINFGLLYGQRADGLVRYMKSEYQIKLTKQEAQQFISRFFAAYTGLKAWQEKARQFAINSAIAEVRTKFGRRRIIPRGLNKSWLRYTCALNMPIQGGCNDGLKIALARLAKELPAHSNIVSTVHDEIIVGAPANEATVVKDIVERTMIGAMTALYPVVPIEVNAKLVSNWGEK